MTKSYEGYYDDIKKRFTLLEEWWAMRGLDQSSRKGLNRAVQFYGECLDKCGVEVRMITTADRLHRKVYPGNVIVTRENGDISVMAKDSDKQKYNRELRRLTKAETGKSVRRLMRKYT